MRLCKAGGTAKLLTLCAAVLVLGCRRREKPSYHEDVAPILAASCVGCHRRGGVAPVPLLETYEQVLAAAGNVRRAVQGRSMPPWGADNSGHCGKWSGALWLTNEQIQTIVRWTEGKKARGDPEHAPAKAPAAPAFGPVGATLDIGAEYRPGIGARAYRCFVSAPALERDRLVTAFRVTSSNPRSVAQVTLYALQVGADAQAVALDQHDEGPGYTCYGSSRVPGARLLMSWTWDGAVLRLPKATGVRLRRGEKTVIQIHYDVIATGPDVPTRTRIDLEFDDGAREASFWDVSPAELNLPPGRPHVEATGRKTLPEKRTLLGVIPRMHTLGKTMQLDRTRAGTQTCLANFDHFNFYRQRFFAYEFPLVLEPGDELRLTCVYNTQNRAEPTTMGDRIEDEECLASLLVLGQ